MANIFILHFLFLDTDIEDHVNTSIVTSVIADPGQTTAPATWTEATASDNSGLYTVTSSQNSGSSFDTGITTDRTGNVADDIFAKGKQYCCNNNLKKVK